MTTMILLLWLAGVGQILITRMFAYRDNISRLTPVVREVFIVFTVVSFGFLVTVIEMAALRIGG